MDNKFSFVENNITYYIDMYDDTLFIEAIYNNDYMVWSTVIGDELTSSSGSLCNSHIFAMYVPTIKYAILKDYMNKTLDTSKIEVIFPNKIKSAKTELCIEIITKTLYGLSHTSTIIIQPKEITFEDKINNNYIIHSGLIDKKIQSFEEKIDGMDRANDINKGIVAHKIVTIEDTIEKMNAKYLEQVTTFNDRVSVLEKYVSTFCDRITILEKKEKCECCDVITKKSTKQIKYENDDDSDSSMTIKPGNKNNKNKNK